MKESQPPSEPTALGYHLPAAAKSESDRAHELVAGALDVEWVEGGAVLSFPASDAWSERIDRFIPEFGRRHPSRTFQRRDPVDGRLALQMSGPGAERWLRASLARAAPSPGARIRRRARLGERVRRWTRAARVLPRFFVIGAPRCGTTTLFHTLMQHPSILPPARKELAFFNLLFRQGLPWYRSRFPGAWERLKVRASTGAFATGDATPSYLFHPHAARRICQTVPEAKLIVVLRDPVERAWSHYHWALEAGYELLPFEEAVDREPERLDGELERMLADEDYLSFPRSYLSYLTMGIYVDQLLAWREVFPEQQMLVLSSAELKREPDEVLTRTLGFLDLPPLDRLQPQERNAGSHAPMHPETRARLKAFFRPHDERLRQLLGRDPGWMGADGP